MALTSAKIEIQAGDATPERTLPTEFDVQFNPAEFTRTKGVQLAEIGIPGLDAPVLQFVRGQSERITLDLLFDTTGHGLGEDAVPVTDRTEPFRQLVKQQRDTHAPPRFTLIWGVGLSFRAVAETVTQRFTLFTAAGVPVRATVSVAMREYTTVDEQVTALDGLSPDRTRQRVVRRGDTLAAIAAREYGDPGMWPLIAEHNGLDDPRRVPPGTVLSLPPTVGVS